MIKRFCAFRFCALFLLLLCALQGKTPQEAIVIAVENQNDRLNPLFSEDHDEAIGLIFSALMRFDEDMKVQGDLAKSWKISKDGLVYEFMLRDDVLWHDGEKFSAKDVAFTLESLNNPKVNSPIRANFEAIKEVKIIDDFHIKITLKEPFPPLLDALSVGILPFHLLKDENLNTTKFNQNPIGTGAFKFSAWKKGQYITLVANENYHLGKVRSPKLILKHISDPNISALELKNNSIDVALVGFEMVESFRGDKNFSVLIEKSADYRALMYNFNNPLFKDSEFRKALNYAVDREMIAQKLLHSLGSAAHHPLQNSWANPKHFHKTNYDLKKAQSILENSGWRKNSRGVLEKNGVEATFDMYAMSNDPLRVALVKVLSTQFAKIGVKANIHAKPAGSFDYTKVDSFLVGWGTPLDPHLHTYSVFAKDGVWNFGHYENNSVDESLKNAKNTLDSAKRKAHYDDFIQSIESDPPFLFLVYLDFPLVYNNNIKGIKPRILGHHGVGFAWNAWQWSKEKH